MLDIIGLQDFPVSIFNTQTAVNSSVIIKKDKNTNDYIKNKRTEKNSKPFYRSNIDLSVGPVLSCTSYIMFLYSLVHKHVHTVWS